MFCGIRSFSCVDDGSWDSSPRPKRSKLKQTWSLHDKGKRNPYSNNGLDKFERLLAELEAKKKEARVRKGGTDEDTVRFRYANDGDWVPIVIKRPKPPPKKEAKPAKAVELVNVVVESKKRVATYRKAKKRLYWNVHCWALVIVLVLMCLVFGRTFAIFGATICWYMVPMMKFESSKKLRKENVKK